MPARLEQVDGLLNVVMRQAQLVQLVLQVLDHARKVVGQQPERVRDLLVVAPERAVLLCDAVGVVGGRALAGKRGRHECELAKGAGKGEGNRGRRLVESEGFLGGGFSACCPASRGPG